MERVKELEIRAEIKSKERFKEIKSSLIKNLED